VFDITVLGELLIDFTQAGFTEGGVRLFAQNPGGAPANVAVGAARLGCSTAMLGKVGADMHGRLLKQTLCNCGVDSAGIIEDEEHFTTLAFVEIGENGERSFSFSRKNSADTQLRTDELNVDALENTKVFHIGSLSLTDEPAREASFAAIKAAKAAGAVISYDPNYRASLWKDEETAKEQIRSVLSFVEMIKLSDEETELLTGFREPEKAGAYLNSLGIACAAVTLGSEGALLCIGGESVHVPGFKVKAIDTTGAGDAFWAAFLHCFVKVGKKTQELTLDDAVRFARFANAAAAICVGKMGAIPSLPDLAQVEAMLAEN